jgi:hypothetical protein
VENEVTRLTKQLGEAIARAEAEEAGDQMLRSMLDERRAATDKRLVEMGATERELHAPTKEESDG